MVRCLAICCRGLGLCCCTAVHPTRSHGTLLCYPLQWVGPALLHPKGSHGTLLCYPLQGAGPALRRSTRTHDTLPSYTQQGAGPAPLRPTRTNGTLICHTLQWDGPALSARRDQTVCCSAMRCIGLGLRCYTRRYRMHCCCAKSAPLASIHPHLWLVHGQGHHPCPLHNPASHLRWAKAHEVRVHAEALGGKIPSAARVQVTVAVGGRALRNRGARFQTKLRRCKSRLTVSLSSTPQRISALGTSIWWACRDAAALAQHTAASSCAWHIIMASPPDDSAQAQHAAANGDS